MDFLQRCGGEAYPDRVTDTVQQQAAQRCGRFDNAPAGSARFSQTEMERIIGHIGKTAAGFDGNLHIGTLQGRFYIADG